MIQKESDLAPATARAAGGSEANKPGSSARARAAAAASLAPSSQLWLGLRDPRIVRVSRALGGKDRHSKVSTVRGLRDRRVRLSVQTAIQLYDLQDRLGLSQPSKVVDWLLDAAQHEIDKLPPLHFPSHFPHVVGGSGNSFGTMPHDRMLRRDTSNCSTNLSKEEDHQQHHNEDVREGVHEESRGVDPAWNSTAVSYYHSSAADDDHTLPDGSSSTVTAAVQLMPGSYVLQPSVSVPSDDPSSYLYYNHRLAVAAPAPSQLSLLPVLSGIKPQTTSSPPAALLFCTPGTIAMPQSLIQAYATSASTFDPKIQDHFHSACSTTTATAGISPTAAPQSYLLPSTNSDSFPAAAPSSSGRLLS